MAVQEPKLGGGWGEVTTGLIYQPITDVIYWAEKNRGAWLHDRRLRVSARRDLADSLIATGIPFFGLGDMAHLSRLFVAVSVHVAVLLRFFSSYLNSSLLTSCPLFSSLIL